MNETLWITLPTNEENKIKEIFNSITDLSNLTLNNLISYFEIKNNCEQGIAVEQLSTDNCLYEEANKWQNTLRNYSAIIGATHLNTNTSEIKGRLNSIKNKFRQHGKIGLADVVFQPNELMCLLIMCYSNPSLIGPRLCKALDDRRKANEQNNEVERVKNEGLIKTEMLKNSAYSNAQRRVLPSQSNLRLMSTALFFNDTSISLPVEVINRVKNETIHPAIPTNQERFVHIIDQRGGFSEWVNETERSAPRKRALRTEDSYAGLQSLQLDTSEGDGFVPPYLGASTSVLPISGNQSELTPEVLVMKTTSNSAAVNVNPMLIMGAGALACANHIPIVSAVGRNFVRTVKDTSTKAKDFLTASFFSSVKSIQSSEEERLQEQEPISKAGYS